MPIKGAANLFMAAGPPSLEEWKGPQRGEPADIWSTKGITRKEVLANLCTNGVLQPGRAEESRFLAVKCDLMARFFAASCVDQKNTSVLIPSAQDE